MKSTVFAHHAMWTAGLTVSVDGVSKIFVYTTLPTSGGWSMLHMLSQF